MAERQEIIINNRNSVNLRLFEERAVNRSGTKRTLQVLVDILIKEPSGTTYHATRWDDVPVVRGDMAKKVFCTEALKETSERLEKERTVDKNGQS